MQDTQKDIQRRRLLQLGWITIVGLTVLAVKSFLDSLHADTILLSTSALTLLSVPVLVKKHKEILASAVFVCVLTVLLIATMWSVGGLRDNAAVAIPGVLIFTALTGAGRLLWPLFCLLTVNVLIIGWVNQQGLMVHQANPQNVSNAFDMVIIIFLCMMATKKIAEDNIGLLGKLQNKINIEEESKRELEYIANHDNLTQLPNRLAAKAFFDRMINNLNRHTDQIAAVFFIDLDDFKGINDTLGHSMGDRFLVAMAKRLKETFRSNDEIFRIGGDEFLVYAQDFGKPEHIVSIAEKLQRALTEPVNVEGHQLQASGSIGIVVVPRDATDYEKAVKRADIAMYRAKEQGKNCYHFYDSAIEHELMVRYELQTGIEAGLQRGDFFVLFQPIVSLTDGSYVGAEALLRWQHPQYGFISPETFIPYAEQNGAIDKLSHFVLKQAQILLENTLPKLPHFYVSVNLSAVQMTQQHLSRELLAEIPEPIQARLKLEMTESQIIENIDIYEANVSDFKQRGIGIFLDDFGTGYSNLGYLQRLKFDTVKIDKSFTRDIHENTDKQPVIRAISNLARELNMAVVAEGVENEAELIQLRNLKIAYGQGYYWSKPAPMSTLLKQLW